jgi:hypothetical protein
MKRTYEYHALVVQREMLLNTLNEKGKAGFRSVSIQPTQSGGSLLIVFEEELIDGARPL